MDYNTNYMQLSWEAPEHDGGSPIMRYILEKRDSATAMWSQVGTVDEQTLQLTADKLFEGQSYYFRVTAENQCGRGQSLQTDDATVAKLPYGQLVIAVFNGSQNRKVQKCTQLITANMYLAP